jgi:hypothetical protein
VAYGEYCYVTVRVPTHELLSPLVLEAWGMSVKEPVTVRLAVNKRFYRTASELPRIKVYNGVRDDAAVDVPKYVEMKLGPMVEAIVKAWLEQNFNETVAHFGALERR